MFISKDDFEIYQYKYFKSVEKVHMWIETNQYLNKYLFIETFNLRIVANLVPKSKINSKDYKTSTPNDRQKNILSNGGN